MHAPNGNAVLALISLTLVLHNTEEYLAFPAFFASAGGDWGSGFPLPALRQRRADCRVDCFGQLCRRCL